MQVCIPDGIDAYLFEQRTTQATTREEYARSCRMDVDWMAPHLVPGHVLDIGCGAGGPSVLLAKLCGGTLHLIDGDARGGERKANFGTRMDPFGNLAVTDRMLEANGITNYSWWPVGATELPPVKNVVSLLSWGWHYPVSAYLAPVVQALAGGGVLILDLRPGKGGERELERHFEFVAEIQGHGKCNRSVWRC